jgi:nitroimidazol reductase NimA-like FMN-containing flavoprotein (pyridoxamine 5'-phosphate oxidase superfamily)
MFDRKERRMGFTVAKIVDVADGPQKDQFTVGSRTEATSLDDLDPIYQQLLDEPVTAVLAVMGADGRANLTPVWFGRSSDKVLLNFAEHRKKTGWIRNNPELTILLMNPTNPYHWISLKVTVEKEVKEDHPDEGHLATETIDAAWTKYAGADPPYGLRDPSMNERRVLFICRVDRVATFGRP